MKGTDASQAALVSNVYFYCVVHSNTAAAAAAATAAVLSNTANT